MFESEPSKAEESKAEESEFRVRQEMLSDDWVMETAEVSDIQSRCVQLVMAPAESACGGCKAKTHCGQSAMASALAPFMKQAGFRTLDIPYPLIPNSLQKDRLKIGDKVVIGLPKNRLVLATLLVYLLPLLGAVIGAIMGNLLAGYWHTSPAQTDGLSLLGAISGVLLIVFGLRWFNKNSLAQSDFEPVILGKL